MCGCVWVCVCVFFSKVRKDHYLFTPETPTVCLWSHLHYLHQHSMAGNIRPMRTNPSGGYNKLFMLWNSNERVNIVMECVYVSMYKKRLPLNCVCEWEREREKKQMTVNRKDELNKIFCPLSMISKANHFLHSNLFHEEGSHYQKKKEIIIYYIQKSVMYWN